MSKGAILKQERDNIALNFEETVMPEQKVFPNIKPPQDHGVRPGPDPRFEGMQPRPTGLQRELGISAEIGRMWRSGIGGKTNLVCMILCIVLMLVLLSIFFPTFDPGR